MNWKALLFGLFAAFALIGCDKDTDDGSLAPAEFESALPGTWKHWKSEGVEDGEAWSAAWSDEKAVFYTFEPDGSGYYLEKGWKGTYTWQLDGESSVLTFKHLSSESIKKVKIERMTSTEMVWYRTDPDGYWRELFVRVE